MDFFIRLDSRAKCGQIGVESPQPLELLGFRGGADWN